MLFYITSSLVTKLKANPTDSAIIEAINNLAFSRKHGYHLLAAEYEDLKFLKECKQLQPFTQSVFNQLFHTWAEIGSLKERFKFQVEIVAEPEILQIKKEEDKEIIELSIDYIQEFEILNKTKIIAENQKEIEFYLYISKLYKNDKRFSAIPSKYSPLMGGGDTTAKVYDTEQNNKNSFCICFADKDIKYPNCKVGATLKKLQDVDNKTNPLCKLIPIDVREIENLIPLKLLKIAHENSTYWKKGFEFISEMITNGYTEEVKYLDFKNGLSLKKFVELKDEKHLEFLKKILNPQIYSSVDFEDFRAFINILKHNLPKQEFTFTTFEQLKEKYVETNAVEQKIVDFFSKPTIIYGMGDNLLNRIIDKHIGNETITKLDLLDFQRKEWTIIGEYITYWTCGGARMSG